MSDVRAVGVSGESVSMSVSWNAGFNQHILIVILRHARTIERVLVALQFLLVVVLLCAVVVVSHKLVDRLRVRRCEHLIFPAASASAAASRWQRHDFRRRLGAVRIYHRLLNVAICTVKTPPSGNPKQSCRPAATPAAHVKLAASLMSVCFSGSLLSASINCIHFNISIAQKINFD